jgi:hypothetical protein
VVGLATPFQKGKLKVNRKTSFPAVNGETHTYRDHLGSTSTISDLLFLICWSVL